MVAAVITTARPLATTSSASSIVRTEGPYRTGTPLGRGSTDHHFTHSGGAPSLETCTVPSISEISILVRPASRCPRGRATTRGSTPIRSSTTPSSTGSGGRTKAASTVALATAETCWDQSNWTSSTSACNESITARPKLPAAPLMNPIRNRLARRRSSASSPFIARTANSRAGRASATNTSPAAVSTTGCELRSINSTPTCSSSRRIC